MKKKSEPQSKVLDQSSSTDHTATNDHTLSLDLFNQLSNLAHVPIPATHEDIRASGYGINQVLESLLGNRVHIIDPASSSISSPASPNRRNAMDGAVNYAKMIGGFVIVNNGEEIRNGFINIDGGVLTKPIVMVINTDPVEVISNQDANAEGGVHWQCCVVLPKNYQPIFGAQLNNPNEIVFYLDSYYSNITLPKAFHLVLQSPIGLSYNFESNDGRRTHRLPPLFPNATIVDSITTHQQSEGKDCGWWALYNALMLVCTGNVDFLQQFTFPSREPAYKLRTLFPGLKAQQPALLC